MLIYVHRWPVPFILTIMASGMNDSTGMDGYVHVYIYEVDLCVMCIEEGGVRRGNMRLSIFCWRWQACKCPSSVFTLAAKTAFLVSPGTGEATDSFPSETSTVPTLWTIEHGISSARSLPDLGWLPR